MLAGEKSRGWLGSARFRD